MFSFAPILAASTGLLLLAGLVPSKAANRQVRLFRETVSGVALLHLAVALTAMVTTLTAGPTSWSLSESVPFVSVLLDSISALMIALVSFVGWVVCRFSQRYLDGESSQGQYFRWIAFTIGAVSMLVIAGNLLLFMAAWSATSLGLHRLLLHYPDRPAAQHAAWTKFAISRLGDAFLVSALVLVWMQFGTFDLQTLFASTASVESSSVTITAIAWLLMLGAVTKSAQFPFHTWLPLTMETPTPVSALMHAGIVNAGGYLVIRMSPLVSQSATAMATLAIIGAVTACFAGVVMLTQTSVKRSLAYSTMAQMGFMMLQCGLGAFSAAMLHILAHSLYKAHAFLSSGSVLNRVYATRGAQLTAPPVIAQVGTAILAAVIAVGVLAGVSTLGGLQMSSKPGGYALGFVLCVAMTTWTWRVLAQGRLATKAVGFLALIALSISYVGSYLAIDSVVGSALPQLESSLGVAIATGVVIASFILLLALHGFLTSKSRSDWLSAWYVHASNGFYAETVIGRLIRPVVPA